MSQYLPDILSAKLRDDLVWPCKTRLSQRVRNVKLSINPQGHVELILPQKQTFSQAQREEFLQSMLPWLQKNLDNLLSSAAQKTKAKELWKEYTFTLDTETLPKSIDFPALNERWTVSIHKKIGEYVQLRELQMATPSENSSQKYAMGEVGIFAKKSEVHTCSLLLQKWLIHRAKPLLIRKTRELAQSMNVSVGKITVKAQRGRWGSCTAGGNISLNCRLLLLSTTLLEHVILHELCHRIHMNHSPAFKALLDSVSPNSLEKDKELLIAWQNLPTWAVLKI